MIHGTYRVSWTSENDLGVFHSNIMTDLEEAENYRKDMAPYWKKVWIEVAQWKRVIK